MSGDFGYGRLKAALGALGASDEEIDFVVALAIKIKETPCIASPEQYCQLRSKLQAALAPLTADEMNQIGDQRIRFRSIAMLC